MISLAIEDAQHPSLGGSAPLLSMPPAAFASTTLLIPLSYNGSTSQKIAGFRAAYGSILFWDDALLVDSLKIKGGDFHGSKAEEWTHQSNGMHQYYMWTALEALGLSANLQHYNPLIDAKVKEQWDIPTTWVLRSQLVFGSRIKGTETKEKNQHVSMDIRLGVFGADN